MNALIDSALAKGLLQFKPQRGRPPSTTPPPLASRIAAKRKSLRFPKKSHSQFTPLEAALRQRERVRLCMRRLRAKRRAGLWVGRPRQNLTPLESSVYRRIRARLHMRRVQGRKPTRRVKKLTPLEAAICKRLRTRFCMRRNRAQRRTGIPACSR